MYSLGSHFATKVLNWPSNCHKMSPTQNIISTLDGRPSSVSGCESETASLRLRESLISALIHDLRSPLGAIGIFCEIQESGKQTDEDSQTHNLSMIRQATAKAQLALEDASEIMALCRRNLALSGFTKEDISAIIHAICLEITESAARKGIKVSPSFSPENLFVECDLERTREILVAMIQEALSATQREGEITVSCGQSPSGISVTVRSNGQNFNKTSSKPPDPYSLRGRLGERRPGLSRYSLAVCAQLSEIMGGSFSWVYEPSFSAILHLPCVQR